MPAASGGFRHENDVEHSFSLAMTAWFLCAHLPHLNKDLVIRYSLVHDMVEVYAGDTFAFASQAELDGKVERERQALEKLRTEWSDFPDMLDTIESYEKRADDEAVFVHALDKILPMMMNLLSDGYTWQKLGLDLDQLHAKKTATTAASPEVSAYYRDLYEIMRAHPEYFPPQAGK